MKSKTQTQLNILIDLLKANYNDYYVKHIEHDFLSNLDEYNNTDSIAYLIDHVRKLNVTDTVYPQYFQYCYSILLSFKDWFG